MPQQLTLREKPHSNHYLFSDYYLDNRLSGRREWLQADGPVADAQAGFERLAGLWKERKSALEHANESQTEEDWIKPVLRALGQGGAAYRALEFTGPGVSTLSVEQRMVLPNLMAEAGAKNAYMTPDERVFEWLAGRLDRGLEAEADDGSHSARVEMLQEMALYPDEDAVYAGLLEVDLGHVEPAQR